MDQNNQYYDMDSYRSGQAPKSRGNEGAAFVGGMVVGALVALLLAGVVVSLVWLVNNNKKGSQQSVAREETEGVTSEDGRDGFVTDRMISKINSLVQTIQNEFFFDVPSDEELEAGLYRGLMDSLGDRYTVYYTPEELEELMTESQGVYFGIGAYISEGQEGSLAKISGVFKKGPAMEAGLRAEDLIYKVDGRETYGETLSDIVSWIKGPEGTKVVLTIVRNGEQMDVEVTRRKVEAPTVESEMLGNGMGYLRLTEFDDVTVGQYKEAMSDLYAEGMKGLILDLRSNPGGNLDTVVQIAQEMLPEGIVVYTEDKAGKRQNYRCKGDKEIQIPMVVLVDMNSASAAEILAGAIQDYGKGTLVGTTTFGKGIVQSVLPARDGSAIKITVSGYFTPNGRNIHKIGIEPDVVCEFDGSLYYDVENPIDNQLEKAKEVLTELMNK